MPQQQALTEPLIEVLGEIDIAGSRAAVTWPRMGDAVGLDFAGQSVRFGVVVDLDSDPRLRVQPDHAHLLDVEERLIILEQAAALWYSSGLYIGRVDHGRAAA
ncbi:hypothetical protein [Glycomyces tarimensis]